MNKPWAQWVVTTDRQLRENHNQFFYLFLNPITFLPPDCCLFQTLHLIKKRVVNEQSDRKQEIAALLAWEKQPHIWANAQEEVLAGALGGISLCCLFLSSKTEISTSRSLNIPCNCQVRLTRLVFLDVYMVTAWTSRGLLPYNTSKKTSASVAADPELENSLQCGIGVPSECCECPKALESPSIATARGINSSCFLLWKMFSSQTTWLSLSTPQHLDHYSAPLSPWRRSTIDLVMGF